MPKTPKKTGETNTEKLLALMSPALQPEEYVFCSVKGKYGDFAELSPLASFRETEGLTLIIDRKKAVLAELTFESVFRAITLTIHSSLDAVGLTAAVASKLSEKGISANVVAAYYHDHIFVPTQKANSAMKALKELCS
jgi:uncharacterized protein